MSSIDYPHYGMTPPNSERNSSTSSLATTSTTTLTSVFPPSGMRGVPQPPVSTKELLIIIFMFCFWAYSLFLTYRLSFLWKPSYSLQGLVQAALLGWGREDQHVGLHHGRGEEEEKGGSGPGEAKQGRKPLSKINDLPSRILKRVSHWKSGMVMRHLTDMKQTMAIHTSLKSQSIRKSDFSTNKKY